MTTTRQTAGSELFAAHDFNTICARLHAEWGFDGWNATIELIDRACRTRDAALLDSLVEHAHLAN